MPLKGFEKKRVLIVDQLDNYSFAIKKMLLDMGLKKVSTANSAQAVLSGLQDIHYDVILCNYDLGDGQKNGQELLEELRERKLLRFSALFFILTAEVSRDKVLGTIENEPDGYLLKPITPKELEKRLAAALTQKQALSAINQAMDEGNFAEAIALAHDRLPVEKRYRLALQKIRAWLFTRSGQWEEARKVFEDVRDRKGALWAKLGLAQLYVSEGEYDAAIEQLDHILAEDRHCVEAYDELARICTLKQNYQEAREILERATTQSPNNLLRQKALAEARANDGDPEAALEAHRKVIKLSPQSIYARPEDYFGFATALGGSDGRTNGKLGKEAIDVLHRSRKRFADREQIDVQVSLMEAQIQQKMGNDKVAANLFDEVSNKIQLRQESLTEDSAVIAAQTLSALGREEEVESFLQQSADKAAKDKRPVGRIYDYLNNRTPTSERQKVTELNREGIRLYSEGNVDAAIQAMSDAIPLMPFHVSLNLNLLQVLLQKGRQSGDAADLLKLAAACLQRVRHLPESHREYRRYEYLRKQMEKQNPS